jgi:curved DNA-binding protein CbpA
VPNNKNHYEILELGTDALLADVRAAHERLSRGIDAADPARKARLDALNEALATLTDPQKRARYDMGMEAREKPASEQIEAIAPSLAPRVIATAVVVVLLGAVAFYFYQEKEAREEAERAAATRAAAEMKQARERAKAAEMEAQERERARHDEQQAVKNEALRETEKIQRRAEADKRAEIEQAKQKKEAEDDAAREKFLRSGRKVIDDNPVIRYPRTQ